MAVEKNHETIVKILLKHKLDKTIRNNNDKTALDLANDSDNKTMVQLLTTGISTQKTIPLTFSPRSSNKRQRNTDKQIASSSSAVLADEEIEISEPPFKQLKIQSTSLSQRDLMSDEESFNERRVTSSAEKINHKSLIKPTIDYTHLFDLVADGCIHQLKRQITTDFLAYSNHKGQTALHIAAQHGQLKCAELLLDKKASLLDSKDIKDRTPLFLLAQAMTSDKTNQTINYARLDVAWLLIRRGANTQCKASNGATVLHEAIVYRQYQLLKIILNSANCNPNLDNADNFTALDLAIQQQDESMVSRLLIDRRLDINTLQSALIEARKIDFSQSARTTFLQLIEKKQALLTKKPKQVGIEWVKHFSIIYGSQPTKPQKTLAINSDKQHAALALANQFTQKRLEKLDNSKDLAGNPVTASLTFIISTNHLLRKQDKQKIRINLNLQRTHHITDTLAGKTPVYE